MENLNTPFKKNNIFGLGISELLTLILWFGIIFLTWYFMHGADHFLQLTQAAMEKYFRVKYILILHITAGGGALISGPPQFLKSLLLYSPKIHRALGYLYLLAVLGSSFTAVILSFTTAYEVNWPYAFSLQVWVSVWISASFIAFRAAIKKQFLQHKQWMVRSYMVTIAFVISALILKMPIMARVGNMSEVSPSIFWFAWSVPLYVYQIILSRKIKA
ncbi:MAG: DUF2306 domain-containing protein [Sphingobacteriaceae bacterium]|nr:DUF2306 domain-containing protein [Sphingobacteriaceae bacterium]